MTRSSAGLYATIAVAALKSLKSRSAPRESGFGASLIDDFAAADLLDGGGLVVLSCLLFATSQCT